MSGVVWITGASSGLGRQAALEFARRGWRVAVTARRADRLAALEAESAGFLGDIRAFPGDVTDGKVNASLPKGSDPMEVTPVQALELLEARRKAPKKKRRTRRS